MSFNINKVAVLGAGVMGAGIAAHIVGAGIPVLLMDILPKALSDKEKAMGLTEESPAFRNKFAQGGKDRVTDPKFKSIYDKDLGQMIEVGNFADNLDRLSECDWIIEVIVEDLNVKKSFMKQINEFRKPGSIVSTNTSGVSINRIVEDMPMEFRKNFLGTHFFNPPRYMNLFEIIPGTETAPELVEFMNVFGTKRLGKGVVLAKDTPNFIGNRIGTFATVNCIQLMNKYGFDIATIDQLTGPVIGRPKSATFRTVDMVGLDILTHVADNVIQNIDDETEKAEFAVPDWVGKLIEKGYLGDKTKQGFFKKVKTDKGSETTVWDPEKEVYVPLERVTMEAVNVALKSKNKYEAIVYGEHAVNQFAWETIKNVLLYSASKVPEITEDYKEIDNGMKWGYNWEKGPFEIWDAIGLEKSVTRMKQEGDKIPAWIEEKIAGGKDKFYSQGSIETPFIHIASPKNEVVADNGDAALVDLGDGVLCLQFKSKGNTVTDKVMDMMFKGVETVEHRYKGLVIGNQSSNFSAGASLLLIGELATNKKWDELASMVEKFQMANMAMKYCNKPIVAAPYGMTLGGGAEISLHTHSIVAHAETYMGLVEAGVGLVPGGGGTKEILLRNTENLVQSTMGNLSNHVKNAWEVIAMAKVSGSAHEAIKNTFLKKSDQIVMSRDYLIDEAKSQVIHMHDSGFRPLIKKPIKVVGTTGRAAIQYNMDFMMRGGFISEYDAHIANKLAYILTGGSVPVGTFVTEEHLLELEKEAFISLCGEEKTLQRIEHMLKKGKALRN